MTKVIGVRFRQAGKIYFFSPGKLEIKTQDRVIVETARGVEFGKVVTGPKEVEDTAFKICDSNCKRRGLQKRREKQRKRKRSI